MSEVKFYVLDLDGGKSSNKKNRAQKGRDIPKSISPGDVALIISAYTNQREPELGD